MCTTEFQNPKQNRWAFILSQQFINTFEYAIKCGSGKVLKWLLSRIYFPDPYSRIDEAKNEGHELIELSTTEYFESLGKFLNLSKESGDTFSL